MTERNGEMSEEPMMPVYNIQSESDFLRERAEGYRTAALMGFGALLARNIDGQYSAVLDAMAKTLDITWRS